MVECDINSCVVTFCSTENTSLLLLLELFDTVNFDNILSFLRDIHLYSPT